MPRPAAGLPRLLLSLMGASCATIAILLLGVDWFFPSNPTFDAGLVLSPLALALQGVIMLALGPRARGAPEAVAGMGGRAHDRLFPAFLTYMLSVNLMSTMLDSIGCRPGADKAAGDGSPHGRALEPPTRRAAAAEVIQGFRRRVRALSLARAAEREARELDELFDQLLAENSRSLFEGRRAALARDAAVASRR